MDPREARTRLENGPIRVCGVLCLAALFLSLGAASAPRLAADVLTLAAAEETALAGNLDLLAVRRRRDEAEARLQKARTWNRFNPEIQAGAAERRFDAGDSDVQPAGGLSLEVEIAGQRGVRIEEAERNLERVQAEIADAERLVLGAVREAFYRSLYLRERRDLFRDVRALDERLQRATAQRLRRGDAPRLDDNLASLRATESARDAALAERDHENSIRALESLLGREPTGETVLVGDLDPDESPAAIDADALVREALRRRSDLAAGEARLGQLDAERRLQRRLRIPNPTLRASYEAEPEPGGGHDRIFGGSLSIALPVFDRKQAELAALSGRRARLKHEQSAAALAVAAEVRDAVGTYGAALEAVALFDAETSERIAESFRLIEAAEREGKIDLTERFAVEKQLVSVRLSRLDSLRDFRLARAALESAVGAPLTEGAAR